MHNYHTRQVLHRGSPDLPSRRRFLRSTALAGSALLLAACGLGTAIDRAYASGQTGTPQLPDTAAGRRFAAWLEAFNNADLGALQAWHGAALPSEQARERAIEDVLSRRRTGAYEPREILISEASRIAVLVFTTLTEQWLRIQIGPMGFGIQPAPGRGFGIG